MSKKPSDFIRDLIDADLASGKHTQVVTRFPPEPNGYLHIGHAKSICLNFGLVEQYKGHCNLRFDDTNPAKEDQEYVDSISSDVRWLGFDYGDGPEFASDYFQTMYEIAERLIEAGHAYVCSLSEGEIRETRGSLREAGSPSPYRDRSVAESLDLFRRMRAGEFGNGAHVLRAKIDMSAANMKMRDPLLYRVRKDTHHRTGDEWPIYPFYDFAHPIEDAIEGITHSLCTLEFENNRDVYDWVIANADLESKPEQTEFARLSLDYTVMSKRKLKVLVDEGHVSGWDDPRMPTLAGMRRRGYRPEAIRRFCDLIGVSKNNSVVDFGKLEYTVRDDLNQYAPRAMAVLRPLKVVLSNYPKDKRETLSAPSYPPDIGKPGERSFNLGAELYIEAEDFSEEPPKGFRRLAPGRWIRLRYAYCIRCDEVIKDEAGTVVELRCSYDESTLGGSSPSDQKVWGIIHWADAVDSLPAEVRIYDRLFKSERPDAGDNFLEHINEDSLQLLNARVEASVIAPDAGTIFQFERQGFFVLDNVDSKPSALVFNRTISLRDSWKKESTTSEKAQSKEPVKKSGRSATRPKSRSKAELRAGAREMDPLLASRYKQYQDQGISESDADMLSGSKAWGDQLETLHRAGVSLQVAAKWLINEQPREDDQPLPSASPAAEFKAAILASEKRISSAAARKLWTMLATEKGVAEELIVSEGLEQVGDDASIVPMIEKVMADNPDKVADYRGGREALMGFFVGQVMRASRGKADAERVKELLVSMLAPILALVLVCLTAACGSQQSSASAHATTEEPSPLGDATRGYAMVMRARTIHGTTIAPEERPTAVVVFASWCGPCRSELATLGELRQKYPTLRVIGINAYETYERRSDKFRLRNFLDANAPWLTQVVHADVALLRGFGNVPNIPTLFVYDKSGGVVAEFRRNKRSPPTHEELEAAIRTAVSMGPAP